MAVGPRLPVGLELHAKPVTIVAIALAIAMKYPASWGDQRVGGGSCRDRRVPTWFEQGSVYFLLGRQGVD